MCKQNRVISRRTLAFLLDYLIIIIPAVVFIAVVITKLNISSDIGLSIFNSIFLLIMPLNILTNIPLENAVVLFCVAFFTITVVYVLYCLLCELIFGITLGGKCAKIRCVTQNGLALSKKEILVRNVLKLLALSCCLLGLITILFKHRKPIYDLICKTNVVMVI